MMKNKEQAEAKKAPHIPRRSPKNTTLTISLPRRLCEYIDELAANDGRNRSEYVRHELLKIAQEAGLHN